MLRILAVIAAIVAVVLFAIYAGGTQPSDLGWGLVALASSLGLFELEGVSLPNRP